MSVIFSEYLATQKKERYKDFIVYSLPLAGKTQFAKKVVELFNGTYIDLMKEFIEASQLVSEIDVFFPKDFIKILDKFTSGNSKFIIIDNLDFVLNAWDEHQNQEFLNFIEKHQTPYVFGFVMQQREFILKKNFENSYGQSRILNLYDIV